MFSVDPSCSQLTRDDGLAHGRLVIRLSEDPASPWLVTFDDQDLPDEELLEDDLGPVVARADDSDANSKNDDGSSKSKGSKKKTLRSKPVPPGKAGSSSDKAGSGSDDSGSPDASKKKKRSASVDFQGEDRHSNADTDVSSPNDSSKNDRSRVSDREQRSRRRQQVIEEEPPGAGGLLKTVQPRPGGILPPPAKKAKTKIGGEEVVKIPMLTGTLYLYRGAKRRVAFVRKV